jgi:hypothetical protein
MALVFFNINQVVLKCQLFLCRLFIAGGDSDDYEFYLSSAFIYSWTLDEWVTLERMSEGRESPACGLLYDTSGL